MSNEPFKTKRYLAIAKEPVFVGTGGYRIGRVDNTIVRDPATNLPKIPGTTIEGNARYYSWVHYKTNKMPVNLGCAKGKKIENEEPCGSCPVCLSYGFATENKAQAGLAYFSDARILFFPVATMIGTVWVTSEEIVGEYFDGAGIGEINETEFIASNSLVNSLPQAQDGKKVLNFGWIMLEHKNGIDINSWKLKKEAGNDEIADLKTIFDKINQKVCIVSSKVFGHIVNSNLETRTSVSINPVTGAAQSGALFTYEALPRGTVFIMDVTYENPANYNRDEDINIVIETVEKGFELFSALGIGGMGTRGFGKIEVLKEKWLEEKDFWEEVKKLVEKLQTEYNRLSNEIDAKQSEIKEETDEGKRKRLEDEKEKLCDQIKGIFQKLNMWKSYVERRKSVLERQQEKVEEIVKLLSAIKIDGKDLNTPDSCKEEGENGSN